MLAAVLVLVAGGAGADSHADRTAIGITVRDSVVDNYAADVPGQRVAQTYLSQVQDVVVYEEGDKRFAATAAPGDGPHLVDITDVDSIDPMRQPWSSNIPTPATPGAQAIDTWVAADGNRYFAVVWATSDALQIFGLHSSGVLWSRWSNGSAKYIIDGSRLDVARDVFVYTLQTGTCQASSGCEVFPGVNVNQGDPIYKNYAVVAAIGNLGQGGGLTGSAVHIYDVTNPNALCSCNSGSGQTALLKGSVTDSGSLELRGATGLEYYQQGNKHYALVTAENDDGIQIIDITDPENPAARDHLSDTTSLELNSAHSSAVYSVAGRLYAVVTGQADDGIQIVDITDPTDITAAGNLADTSSLLLDNPRGVAVHTIGGLHYAVVASLADDGIQIVDVTDPSAPVAKANLAHASSRQLDGSYGVDTFSDGDRHFAVVAAASSSAVQIVELTAVTAEAGNDVNVPATITQVTLDGTGSVVSSGATPTYQWTQTAGTIVTLNGAATAQPTFTPPSSSSTLTFRLTVTAAGVSSSDTVVVTVEGSSASVDSFGARIGGNAVDTEQVQKPDGGTATYMSMHFSAENETQVITYTLLEEPTGTATVNVMKLVQSAGYGAAGYTWDWDAVSVSPSTLTFTASNWSEPQAINITSNADPDRTPEQVLIVFQTSALGQYTGIHITVDDPAQHQSSPSTDGGLVILELLEDPEPLEQHEESEPERQPQQESKQEPKREPAQEPTQEPEPEPTQEPEPEPDPEPRDCSGLEAASRAATAAYMAALSPTNWPDMGPMLSAKAAWQACLAQN